MGSPVKPLATAVLGLLLLVGLSVVQSSPEQVKLQLSQRKDEIVVMWVTPYWAGTSFVEYGDTPGQLTSRKWTQSNRNYYFKGGYGSDSYARDVILKNLKPNTRYYYRVGNDLQGWSSQYSFKTRHDDPNRKVVFAAVADQDINTDSRRVLSQMLTEAPEHDYDFVVVGGDIAYANGNQEKWNQYGRFMQPLSANYPTMFAIGDRDIESGDAAAYRARMRYGISDQSHMWGWAPHWYSFNAGPVHVVILSSEHDSRDEAEAQAEFLDKDLKRADDPENRLLRPWIVVFVHRPSYNNPPGGGNNQRGLADSLKSRFLPLYAKYKVNAVVCGHCHNYERTFPMTMNRVMDTKRGWEDSPYFMPVYDTAQGEGYGTGTVHITVGTGGRPVENVGLRPSEDDLPCVVKHTWGNVFMGGRSKIEREADCSNGCFSKENTAYINADRGFGLFEADRDKLHFKFISASYSGQLVDEAIMCAKPLCGTAPPVGAEEWDDTPEELDREDIEEPPEDIPDPTTRMLPVYDPQTNSYAPMPVGMNLQEFLASNRAAERPASVAPAGDGPADTASAASSTGFSVPLIAGVAAACGVVIIAVAAVVGYRLTHSAPAEASAAPAVGAITANADAEGDVVLEMSNPKSGADDGAMQPAGSGSIVAHSKKPSLHSFPLNWLSPRT
eukprot:jgi/Tetstr1/461629/TSEL_006729.t1